MSALVRTWRSFHAQWRGNAKVRLGCWLILGLAWGYGLMVNSDRIGAAKARIEELDLEVSRLKPVLGVQDWPARTEEAQKQLADLRSLLWTEASSGLAQAEVQDWLRQTSAKVGITVRDLRLTTAENAGAPDAGKRPQKADGLPAEAVKARLTVDFKPVPFASLLSEVAMSRRLMVMERLQLRTWNAAPQAELDIRVPVSRTPANGP